MRGAADGRGLHGANGDMKRRDEWQLVGERGAVCVWSRQDREKEEQHHGPRLKTGRSSWAWRRGGKD